jgi:2-deoxy-D-gluconate 3-dehydrogenase
MQDIENLCSLEGKVAIVTGSGRGIGQGIATVFARAGADVVIAELDQKTADDTRRGIESMGRRALVTRTDVTDPGSVAEMLAASLDAFGRVDILVNNVGGVVGRPKMVSLLEMDLDYWDGVVKLNMTSCFLCCKACIGYWVENARPGRIINVASLGAIVPFKTSLAYGAAKAGVISMTKTLAALYGKNDIRVNCIATRRHLSRTSSIKVERR